MKTLLTSLLLLSASTLLADPTGYTVDAGHSSVGFRVRHVVSTATGTFGKFSGKILYDAARPDTSRIEGVVEVASVNTHDADRDKHLLNGDFFKAEKHPRMTFRSTAWKTRAPGLYQVTGDLAIAGVTKPVTLDVSFTGEALNPFSKKTVAGFSATGVIKRSDWGMSYGTPMVGDEVTIQLEVEAVKEPAA